MKEKVKKRSEKSTRKVKKKKRQSRVVLGEFLSVLWFSSANWKDRTGVEKERKKEKKTKSTLVKL
jgi:hypothetical protein